MRINVGQYVITVYPVSEKHILLSTFRGPKWHLGVDDFVVKSGLGVKLFSDCQERIQLGELSGFL